MDFPAIEPLNRSYGLGSHPVTSVEVQNGDETRFLHGLNPFGVPLSLEFVALSFDAVQQIRLHWQAQSGTVKPFVIPPELWRTHSSLYDVVPSDVLWRYSSKPVEHRSSGGLFDVSVSMISVL